MIRRGDTFRGDAEDRDVIRDGSMSSMISLMTRRQVALVEGTIRRWAPSRDEARIEKVALEKAKDVLNRCREDVGCYLEEVAKPEVQEKPNHYCGIKAAKMLGILGGPSTPAEILKRLPHVENEAIRFTLGLTLDHLTPNGDPAVAASLREQVARSDSSGHGLLGPSRRSAPTALPTHRSSPIVSNRGKALARILRSSANAICQLLRQRMPELFVMALVQTLNCRVGHSFVKPGPPGPRHRGPAISGCVPGTR